MTDKKNPPRWSNIKIRMNQDSTDPHAGPNAPLKSSWREKGRQERDAEIAAMENARKARLKARTDTSLRQDIQKLGKEIEATLKDGRRKNESKKARRIEDLNRQINVMAHELYDRNPEKFLPFLLDPRITPFPRRD